MGRTRISFDIPDSVRHGLFSNLATVWPVEESDTEATIDFLFIEKSGTDGDGEAFEDGIMQARVIMPRSGLKALKQQIELFLDENESE